MGIIQRLLETGRKQARSVSAVVELAGKTSIVCEGEKTTVKNNILKYNKWLLLLLLVYV